MRLENAVVVDVEFDGDAAFKESGYSVFYGDYGYVEAKAFVRRALGVLSDAFEKKYGKTPSVDVTIGETEFDVRIPEIIKKDELMEAVMTHGGVYLGNWYVDVAVVGKRGRMGGEP